MSQNSDFVSDLMDFNPNDLSMFHEEAKPKSNFNIYKTNPANSKSDDKHYHSKVRILYNPFNVKSGSIVNNISYSLQDDGGRFLASSKLTLGDRECVLFKTWKKMHFSSDETVIKVDGQDYTLKTWGDKNFNKVENKYVLVQIIEDQNQPELVGKIMPMRLPKVIYDTLINKMNPSNGDAPVDLMNYLFGPVLKINVTPGEGKTPEERNRSIKYTLCEFDTEPCPITKVDGTPLFNDDEMTKIEEYDSLKKKYLKARTEKDKEAKKKACMDMTEDIKTLMQKAFDYLKENAVDLEKECGYKEWSPEMADRINRFLQKVTSFQDPTKVSINEILESKTAPATETPAAPAPEKKEDDLPF